MSKLMNEDIRTELLQVPLIKDRVGHALLMGFELTQGDCVGTPFHTSRLSAIIFELRKEMDIKTETVNVECGDGHVARVARYRYVGEDKMMA